MDYAAYRDRLQARLPEPTLAFATGEYAARLDALREAMDARGFDVVMLSDPADLCYFTGYSTFEVSVQCALLVSATASALFVPAIEIGPAVYLSRVDRVHGYAWQAPGSVSRMLADEIGRLAGGPRPAVGVDLWSTSLGPGLLDGLRATLTTARFDDVADLTDRIRLVKSPAELAYLAESAEITRLGIEASANVIAPGVLDHEIARAGANAMIGHGSEFMSMQPIVATGFRSGIIHTNHAGFRVAPGDVVFTEFGSARARYTAPIMRTAVAGRATDEMHEFHQVCRAVLEQVMGAMRPGERFSAAARAGAEAIAPVADRAFFSGVYGYPVGVQFPPSWVSGSTFIAESSALTFETDMVFHLPICLRKPAVWGIGFSETVRVAPGGAQRITANDTALRELG